MKQKKILIVATLIIFLIVILAIFTSIIKTTPKYEYVDGIRLINNSIDLRVAPTINLSYMNIPYLSSGTPVGVDWMKNHQAFDENYSGEDLSIDLRDSIVKRMMNVAEINGENSTTFLKAIFVCYSNWTERPNMIPCYAQRANFNGTEIWIIGFNRGIGYEGSISHEDLCFISIPMIEDGSYINSPSDTILYWFGSD